MSEDTTVSDAGGTTYKSIDLLSPVSALDVSLSHPRLELGSGLQLWLWGTGQGGSGGIIEEPPRYVAEEAL